LITGLGILAGTAACGLPGRASAFNWPWQKSGSGRSGVNLSVLPSEWLRREGRHVHSYARYIDSLRLRNITTQQVIVAHAKKRGSVWNSIPPREAWRSIGPTLKVLDRVSRELNVPVTDVVSVFRNPAYNSRCAGARRNSWHLRNYAVDVKMGAKPSTVASMARRLRDRGYFRGGIGRYWSFTHVDTRGTNVDW
jgi:hypothetical protein